MRLRWAIACNDSHNDKLNPNAGGERSFGYYFVAVLCARDERCEKWEPSRDDCPQSKLACESIYIVYGSNMQQSTLDRQATAEACKFHNLSSSSWLRSKRAKSKAQSKAKTSSLLKKRWEMKKEVHTSYAPFSCPRAKLIPFPITMVGKYLGECYYPMVLVISHKKQVKHNHEIISKRYSSTSGIWVRFHCVNHCITRLHNSTVIRL